jgi:hypothetical protein
VGEFQDERKTLVEKMNFVKKVNLVGLGKEMAKMARTNLLTNGS